VLLTGLLFDTLEETAISRGPSVNSTSPVRSRGFGRGLHPTFGPGYGSPAMTHDGSGNNGGWSCGVNRAVLHIGPWAK
jgi:hypothetical protein